MVLFLVILHIQINKFNYRLLITPKIDHHIDVGKLRPKGKCCSLPWLDNCPKMSYGKQTKSVLDCVRLLLVVQLKLNPILFSEIFYLHAPRRHKIRNMSLQ